MADCRLDRFVVEFMEKTLGEYTNAYMDLFMEELEMQNSVDEVCAFNEPGAACQKAREELIEHQTTKMDPLWRTIEKFSESNFRNLERLMECEHKNKGHLLA